MKAQFIRGVDPKDAMGIGISTKEFVMLYLQSKGYQIIEHTPENIQKYQKKTLGNGGFMGEHPISTMIHFTKNNNFYEFWWWSFNIDKTYVTYVCCLRINGIKNFEIDLKTLDKKEIVKALDKELPKNITESQNFVRGIDPKEAMGIGLIKRYKETIAALQNTSYTTNFDENDLTYMVTASNNYDSETEYFHNPAGHPAYDWEEVCVRSDFQIIHEATIDLKNNRLIYSIFITNPDIPNFKWSDTSTIFIDANASSTDILELIEEEFSTYDVYEAAMEAKEKADENVQEGEDEIEDVLGDGESMNENENEEYDSSDNGYVDVDDNIDGSVTISYKHQTSEDDHEVDQTRSIDTYHMDTCMALKLGLSLKAVHDDEVNIVIKNINKLKDDKWIFVTNFGNITLTLGDLERLADKC